MTPRPVAKTQYSPSCLTIVEGSCTLAGRPGGCPGFGDDLSCAAVPSAKPIQQAAASDRAKHVRRTVRPPRQRPIRRTSPQSRQLLQQVPVLQPVLLGREQRLRRVAVLVEVLGEPALAAGEVDESHFLVRLRIGVPIALD